MTSLGTKRERHRTTGTLLLVLAAVGCSAATTVGVIDGGSGQTGGTSTGGTGTGGIPNTGGIQDATGGMQEATGGSQSATGGAQPATGGAQQATGGAFTGGVGGFSPYACTFTLPPPPPPATGGISGGPGGSSTGGAYGNTPLSRFCDASCPPLAGLIEPQTAASLRAVLARSWRWCTASRPLFDLDQSLLAIDKNDTFTIYGHWTYSLQTGEGMLGPIATGTVTYGAPSSSELTFTPSGGQPFTATVVLGSLPGSNVELIVDSGPNQRVYLGY